MRDSLRRKRAAKPRGGFLACSCTHGAQGSHTEKGSRGSRIGHCLSLRNRKGTADIRKGIASTRTSLTAEGEMHRGISPRSSRGCNTVGERPRETWQPLRPQGLPHLHSSGAPKRMAAAEKSRVPANEAEGVHETGGRPSLLADSRCF